MSGGPSPSGPCVVSGVGLIASLGRSPGDLHEALCAALPSWQRGARPPSEGATSSEPPHASIEGFNVKDHLDRRGLKDVSRTSQLACAAAAPLAGLLRELPPDEVGIVLGSAWGSLSSVVDFEWESCTLPVRLMNPLLFAETVSNAPAGQVSIHLGWSGFNLTVSCGSASGLAAIAEGCEQLFSGRARVVVAGGADAINHPALRALRANATVASNPDSCPFAMSRRGLIGGEGACFVALQSREMARARGDRALALVRAARVRYAPPAATGAAAPEDGVADLLRELLEGARLRPADVQLVVASACGSPAGDRAEARALHEVFGGSSEPPFVLAPKGILGETWGASGPLALAAAVESLRLRRVPGRPSGFVPDPDLPPLNLPSEPRAAPIRNALVLAATESGHVAALLLSEPEERDAS